MIQFAKPWLDEHEADAASDAVLSGWVTQGPRVAEFEQRLAGFVGASHASAVSSCTAALHLALRAVGVAAGDEVVTVSYSFIATSNAIRYLDAVPVYVDIDPGTYNMRAADIEQAITPRTKAILCVHQLGMPCDIEAISAAAQKHGLALVEDAACALGAKVKIGGDWQAIGRPHGDVACFSFHPRKVITTGDGGMITTNRKDIDDRVKLWRHQGMSIPDYQRAQSDTVLFDAYPDIGYNYRMTDIQAAVGVKQMDKLPEIINRRRRLGARYIEELGGIDGIGLPIEPEYAEGVWQTFNIRLPDHCDQVAAMQSLLDRGISTRRGTLCSHLEPAYRDVDIRLPLPETERAFYRTIALPLYPQMTDNEQNQVISAVGEVCRTGDRAR